MGARSSIIAALALAAAGFAAPAGAAELFNGSFEDILNDWAADANLFQTPGEFEHKDENGDPDGKVYTPIHGSMLGVIQAGFDTSPMFISQTFTTKGGTFSGSAAFLAEDFADYNDYGYVRLISGGDVIELFYRDIAGGPGVGVGSFGYTDWTSFSTVLAAGTYTLEAGVANGVDGDNPSFLLVDDFRMNAVPEPTTWALMIMGFGLAGAALRRRKPVPVPIRVDRDRRR